MERHRNPVDPDGPYGNFRILAHVIGPMVYAAKFTMPMPEGYELFLLIPTGRTKKKSD